MHFPYERHFCFRMSTDVPYFYCQGHKSVRDGNQVCRDTVFYINCCMIINYLCMSFNHVPFHRFILSFSSLVLFSYIQLFESVQILGKFNPYGTNHDCSRRQSWIFCECFSEKIRLDISCESSARHQALYFSKDKSKKEKKQKSVICCNFAWLLKG